MSKYGATALIDFKNACIERIKQNAKNAMNSLDEGSKNYLNFKLDIESEQRHGLARVESIFLNMRKSGNYLPDGIGSCPVANIDAMSAEGFNSMMARSEANKEKGLNDNPITGQRSQEISIFQQNQQSVRKFFP